MGSPSLPEAAAPPPTPQEIEAEASKQRDKAQLAAIDTMYLNQDMAGWKSLFTGVGTGIKFSDPITQPLPPPPTPAPLKPAPWTVKKLHNHGGPFL